MSGPYRAFGPPVRFLPGATPKQLQAVCDSMGERLWNESVKGILVELGSKRGVGGTDMTCSLNYKWEAEVQNISWELRHHRQV